MSRKQGSVLVVTMGFVVAFTLLGMAALHFAMVQNEATERQKASMEAFWLADGAVEKARAEFPSLVDKDQPPVHLVNELAEPLTNKYFDVHTRRKVDPDGYQRQFRYEVLSYGSVNGEQRFILAELDKFNIPDFPLITTSEPINAPVPPKIVERIDNVLEDACGDDNLFRDNNNLPSSIEDVLCLHLVKSEFITIPERDPNEPANVLVIDVTGINSSDSGGIVPTITFASPINGIVQIRGDVKLNQSNLNNVNLHIDGALIVDGTVEFVNNNPAADEPELIYNAQLVDEALLLVPSFKYFDSYNLDAKIIKWEEVADLGEQI